jgi:hypothetical protein
MFAREITAFQSKIPTCSPQLGCFWGLTFQQLHTLLFIGLQLPFFKTIATLFIK